MRESGANSYAAKDLTPWYPVSIKPVRKGLYMVECDVYAEWAYWGGEFWGFRCTHPQAAYDERQKRALGPVYKWRGLRKLTTATNGSTK